MNEIKSLIKGIMDEQVDSLLKSDEDTFLRNFSLNGYDIFYLQKWFEGYASQKAIPERCDYKIISVEKTDDNLYDARILLEMEYSEFDNENMNLKYIFKYSEEKDSLSIVKSVISIEDDIFEDQKTEETDNYVLRDFALSFDEKSNSKSWWENYNLIEMIKDCKEEISPLIYSRAIKKSVRFRNTHSEIDSAHVLSDIMSIKLQKAAYRLKGSNMEETICRMISNAKNCVTSKSYSDIEDETSIKELSLLEQYSFDENAAIHKNGIIPMSCVELCSYYMCILIMAGVDTKDIFILTQPFHYLLLFKYDNEFYIINSSEILKMSPKRLYMGTEVTRIFNPFLYLDENTTNMSEEMIHTTVKKINEAVPIFTLPCNKHKAAALDESDLYEFENNDKNDENQTHRMIRRYVFSMANKYPDSVFTWAKYSYQSLFVCHPQAYFLSAMKDKKVLAFAEDISSLENLERYIFEEIDEGSIFAESDRIMVPRQVLDHKKGLNTDKALLMAVIIKLNNFFDDATVIYSKTGEFVLANNKDASKVIFDIRNRKRVSEITGDVLLAWNNKNLYSAFSRIENNDDWLNEIINMK